MFDGLTDDDDSFFTPVSSANLASLFGIQQSVNTVSSANTSLTYTAPKQPSKINETSKSVSKTKYQSSVIIFKEVHAFKLVEKNYLNQGKCGLALIGNDSVQIYQLLLYKQKNDIISTSKVVNQFEFIVQKDNYASYYDDQKQNWTVHFNSESDLNEFLKTLESRGSKVNKEKLETTEVIDSSKTKLPIETVESPKQIDSDNQSDTSGTNAKASILSRMAKMGQKLLPNTSVSDGTDSDTEKDKLYNKNRKTKRTSNVVTSPAVNNPTERSEVVNKSVCPQGLQPPVAQFAMVNGQYIPIVTGELNSMLPIENMSLMYSSPSYEHLQMYFTENRTHNSEVRMNLLRLTNKVEEVLEKVQKTNESPSKESLQDPNNINNENLKLLVDKLEKTIESNKEQEQKRNMEFLKAENSLKQENEDLKKSIKQLEDKENEYKQKIHDLQNKLKECDTNRKKLENIDDVIKKIMNNLYHEVNNSFKDEDNVQGKEIKKILAEKIIDNTYSIIAAINEHCLSESNENILE